MSSTSLTQRQQAIAALVEYVQYNLSTTNRRIPIAVADGGAVWAASPDALRCENGTAQVFDGYGWRVVSDDTLDVWAEQENVLLPPPSEIIVIPAADDSSTGREIVTSAARLDQNPAAVYLAALTSPRSRRVMQNALDTIAAILSNEQTDALALNWAALRYQHTAAIRSQLAERYSPSSVNRMLSALRGVLKAAWQLGYMGAEDYHRARAVQNVSGETLPAGRDLQTGEVLALATVCKGDDTPAGIRDNAMIGVLYSCGLRRAELIALDVADFDPASGKLIVRHGKGNKQRTVYAQNGALLALHKWLRTRGEQPGALFVPVKKNGQLANDLTRLTPQAVYYMLKKRGKGAGLDDFSPHDFRRTFVGDLLDRGADISTVQKLAGHSNVTTTQRYDRRPEEVKKRAAALLHYPG